MSPFEHQALALPQRVQVANLIGWLQYRKLVPQECQDDNSVPILNTTEVLALISPTLPSQPSNSLKLSNVAADQN